MSKKPDSGLLHVASSGRFLPPGHTRVVRDWGGLDVHCARGAQRGWCSYQLTVVPPGTSPDERRRLSLLRAWLSPGAYIAPFVVALAWVGSPALAGVALAAYLGMLVFARRGTRRLRAGTRAIAVNAIPGGWAASTGELQLFRQSVQSLDALDESDRIDRVRYELEWAAVYNTLPTGGRRTSPVQAVR